MSAKRRKANRGVATVAADGRLTIHGVAELRDALIAAFADSTAVSISLDNDEQIDVAGAQLLVALYREAAQTGSVLSLPERLPEPIQKWAERAGLVFDRVPNEVSHE